MAYQGNMPMGGNPEQQPMMEQGYAGQPGGGPQKMPAATTSSMNLMWFGAACCVMVGGFLGCFILLFQFQLIDTICQVYIFFFGGVLAVLETPFFKAIKIVPDLQRAIHNQCHALTRVTGKGICFLFVGSLLWASWFNNMSTGFAETIAVLLGLVICGVGIFSTLVGVKKSYDINTVRIHFKKDGPQMVPQAVDAIYQRYAQVSQYGLTPAEFGTMVRDIRGSAFESADLNLIYNALSGHPRKDFISRDDLYSWANGSFVLL
eukprot:gnl/TRDRNA2_/TRDRNA2_189842_c0_seq1.p1 gnl/TRDRNA2_/TRDRNA2_189842_c0~~gnl/TRDRNA2_/TRDRNA2_189842_c0_seq1.p1  ORF type:complete len:262 (+),score=44.28 gnl/TRDRNA2_/TRDRNA2_189842_c0_seq1:107-892(+)